MQIPLIPKTNYDLIGNMIEKYKKEMQMFFETSDEFVKNNEHYVAIFKKKIVDRFPEVKEHLTSTYTNDLNIVFDTLHTSYNKFNNAYKYIECLRINVDIFLKKSNTDISSHQKLFSAISIILESINRHMARLITSKDALMSGSLDCCSFFKKDSEVPPGFCIELCKSHVTNMYFLMVDTLETINYITHIFVLEYVTNLSDKDIWNTLHSFNRIGFPMFA